MKHATIVAILIIPKWNVSIGKDIARQVIHVTNLRHKEQVQQNMFYVVK